MQMPRTERWLLWAASSFICLTGLSVAGSATADSLEKEAPLGAGAWTGFYQPSGTDRVDAEFLVEEAEGEPSGFRLTVRLDFEPRERFTFVAEELTIEPDGITFRFGREENLRECALAGNGDGELVGSCVASDGSGGRSRVVMKRPGSTEQDVAAAPPAD